MLKFISFRQMLDWGQSTLAGPASVLRLAEHNYYLAYRLTPHAGGIGYTLIGEWLPAPLVPIEPISTTIDIINEPGSLDN